MICGYRKTGKDTLVKMFNDQEEFKWLIYHSPLIDDLKIDKVKRIGLADALRKEVNTIYNISDGINYDTFKETKMENGKTYRDILIEHGTFRRSQDINYWVRQVINLIYETDGNIMITDWRFVNELNYLVKWFDIITIRLFRSEVPIPSYEVESEHNLDNVLTNYLLVTSEEEFKKACEIFPQYNNFIRQ